MDLGSIIALTTIAYKGADLAWNVFQNTLRYSSDSEDLILQLELERFRFQTWARNAGLTEGELSAGLFPIYETVERNLRVIGELFENADHLREQYGLCASQSEVGEPDKVKRFITKMRRSIRASGIKLDVAGNNEDEDESKQQCHPEAGPRAGPGKRLWWGVRDRKQFKKLISDLESHVEKLNKLLTETQQRSVEEDRKRIDIVFVGNANDDTSLQLIREALGQEPETSSIRALVERKALSDGQSLSSRSSPRALTPLTLNDFCFPVGFQSQGRFMAKSTKSGEYVLLERKAYDRDISMQDKQVLAARLNRLVLLLSGVKSLEFRTPRAIGFVHDPGNLCWWIIFEFPGASITGAPRGTVSTQPVSLLALLESKLRPALQTRLHLASTLATTFSELYGSSWLHKNIRSENILFPYLYEKKQRNSNNKDEPSPLDNYTDIPSLLSSPLVAGFNYSRQETEAQTIDKNQFHDDIRPVIYRHPSYQGEAAQGYRIGYDVYSFGLVLAEIAWWVPLASFLDARASNGSVVTSQLSSSSPLLSSSSVLSQDRSLTSTSTTATTSPRLSSTMKRFHRPEALELQRRVCSRADRELAFRVGTTYFDVVKWCLGYADRHNDVDGTVINATAIVAPALDANAAAVEDCDDWHPALEFYNRVVVPLRRIANMD
ncbi:hypothetical protein AJ79_04597 [Helicocarpus griseus UAMH5409]|uniref:Prion-inhibition and propagation HeLo domain-containing protein n=1 Tax=Helicocarpus griseus UAMH5409 TaxID=1447875 RepID=A0A2B7XSH7_9EURO|nr:hypothetical protein AJ79_04597 [Helicocarpus griseus UAMH5409]